MLNLTQSELLTILKLVVKQREYLLSLENPNEAVMKELNSIIAQIVEPISGTAVDKKGAK